MSWSTMHSNMLKMSFIDRIPNFWENTTQENKTEKHLSKCMWWRWCRQNVIYSTAHCTRDINGNAWIFNFIGIRWRENKLFFSSSPQSFVFSDLLCVCLYELWELRTRKNGFLSLFLYISGARLIQDFTQVHTFSILAVHFCFRDGIWIMAMNDASFGMRFPRNFNASNGNITHRQTTYINTTHKHIDIIDIQFSCYYISIPTIYVMNITPGIFFSVRGIILCFIAKLVGYWHCSWRVFTSLHTSFAFDNC